MPMQVMPDGALRIELESEGHEPSRELREERIARALARYADVEREHGRIVRDNHTMAIAQAVSAAGLPPLPFLVLYHAGRFADDEWSDSVAAVAILVAKAQARQAVAGQVLS